MGLGSLPEVDVTLHTLLLAVPVVVFLEIKCQVLAFYWTGRQAEALPM